MRKPVVPILLLTLAFSFPQVPGGKEPEPERPADSGFVEKAGTHLGQIDVSLSGDPAVLDSRRAEDFEVRVLQRIVEGAIVDRVCAPDDSRPQALAPPGIPASASPSIESRTRPATHLFYFDQPHLTMAGRQRAIDLAREMIPGLVRDGNRGILVSDGQRFETLAGPTSDAAELVAALDRLENDPTQWDSFSYLEESRVSEVLDILNDRMGGLTMAIARARSFQTEEAWHLEKSIAHVKIALQALADAEPPKALLYFADTLRSKPGDHYLQMFSTTLLREQRAVLKSPVDIGYQMRNDAAFGELSLDRLLNEAAARGVRFYTVEAQGLTSSLGASSVSLRGSYGANNATIPGSVRIRQAQDTLGSMAAETGGRAFLNGVSADRMIGRIESDLACVFLVSFDPAGLPQDEPIPVAVKVRKPGVEVRSRGRLVIESASARQEKRLLSAFVNARASASASSMGVAVVPTGMKDGKFSGLVQVSPPASPYPDADWDIGFSVVGREKVRDEASMRASVASPGVPLVLERETTFPPGPFEVVAVARETSTGQIVSRQFEGAWPDLRIDPAAVGPIVLLQPVEGGFRRDEEVRTSGPLAVDERQAVRGDLPGALVSLVCRGARTRGDLRVERLLSGETTLEFDPIEIESGEETCVQTRDLVRAGTLGAGEFTYEIRVLEGKRLLARRERRFHVGEPGPAAGGGLRAE
mgnify:CR=1 FL=1